MVDISKLIMMVGLPGSGKSTLAEQLSNECNAEIVASDEIRNELFNGVYRQQTNWIVFKEMASRTNRILNLNQNVIYDSTNLDRRGIQLLSQFQQADKKIVYYLNNPISTILSRNEMRESAVPPDVIFRMYTKAQIPVRNEGWDQVIFNGQPEKYISHLKNDYERWLLADLDYEQLFTQLSTGIAEFADIQTFPDIAADIYDGYKQIKTVYHQEDKLLMLWVSLLKDIGVPFCKFFGEATKEAQLIRHENVSSQLAAVYLDLMGYSDEFIQKAVTLIQFQAESMKGQKKINTVKKLTGDDLFTKLIILRGTGHNLN
ncbi:ATP-binding protein [Bacillus sp. T33-2]|uniref:ATP-binding protein n=1 Tax=Bacillus sp. T33-2 TaxID=2054168 RepID=UPI000CC5C497|nr:ATP-binding protein [Bacillus sp. T33-2]PLR89773.1 hypothetical protein CVD19_23505 [Bacillus sp. T33-2]